MPSRGSTVAKVIILHPSDELYGADKVLLEIVGALRDTKNLEVWLPTDVQYPERKLSSQLSSMGVRVVFVDLPVLRSSYIGVSFALRIFCRSIITWCKLWRARPDLVYVNTAALAPTVLLARAAGVASLLHLHEDIGTPLKRLVVLPMIACASEIFAVSNAVRGKLPTFVQRKSRTIYNGFSLPQHSPAPRVPPKTFLLSSRWNTWKGHKEFLAAWEEANLSNAKLVILGAAPEVGQSVNVEVIVAGMQNSSSVEIVGQTDNVASYLDACHVVVVPSIQPDPLPTIAIEALAAGRPIMASDIGGLPEIVEHGVTGWLLDPADKQSWIEALVQANNSVHEDRSSSLRQVFETRFGQDRFKSEIRFLVDARLGGKTT